MLLTYMKLSDQPQKLTQDATLLQNQKCIVKAYASTLTLPILIDNTPSGHLFIGKGEFTIDAIIETTRGAIGKPITRTLSPDKPFLMISEAHSLNKILTPASTQDYSDIGYKNKEELLKTANSTFDHFAHRRHGQHDIKPDAHIFAFATEHDKWDILVAKKDKLVYTSKHRVYVSRDNSESVSVGPSEILVAKKGKAVVIDKGNILVERD